MGTSFCSFAIPEDYQEESMMLPLLPKVVHAPLPPLTYETLTSSTQRKKEKLVDSMGYSYIHKKPEKNGVIRKWVRQNLIVTIIRRMWWLNQNSILILGKWREQYKILRTENLEEERIYQTKKPDRSIRKIIWQNYCFGKHTWGLVEWKCVTYK